MITTFNPSKPFSPSFVSLHLRTPDYFFFLYGHANSSFVYHCSSLLHCNHILPSTKPSSHPFFSLLNSVPFLYWWTEASLQSYSVLLRQCVGRRVSVNNIESKRVKKCRYCNLNATPAYDASPLAERWSGRGSGGWANVSDLVKWWAFFLFCINDSVMGRLIKLAILSGKWRLLESFVEEVWVIEFVEGEVKKIRFWEARQKSKEEHEDQINVFWEGDVSWAISSSV